MGNSKYVIDIFVYGYMIFPEIKKHSSIFIPCSDNAATDCMRCQSCVFFFPIPKDKLLKENCGYSMAIEYIVVKVTFDKK